MGFPFFVVAVFVFAYACVVARKRTTNHHLPLLRLQPPWLQLPRLCHNNQTRMLNLLTANHNNLPMVNLRTDNPLTEHHHHLLNLKEDSTSIFLITILTTIITDRFWLAKNYFGVHNLFFILIN